MIPHKPLNLKPSSVPAVQPDKHRITPWRILIVDDDAEVHEVTRLVLAKTMFQQRPIEMLSAYSGAQAREMLQKEDNIAVILLDVVMESEDSGLQLVQTIRQELGNTSSRIILRTGQPGQAPEERIIVDYDINDYKAKSELTSQKLFTTVIASLRAYETIVSLERTRVGLEKIIDSTSSLFQINSMREFASGVLTQLSTFLGCKPEGILCIEEGVNAAVPPDEDSPCANLAVVAATGSYGDCVDSMHLMGTKGCRHEELVAHVRKALHERKSQFDGNITALYLETGEHKAIIAMVNTGQHVDEHDQRLLSVFASKISIALANIIHYQKMITAEEAATTDFLTGINNRRQLLRHGIPMLAMAQRSNTPLTVAMLDIDHFKAINDSYGHDAGDIVLKKIGTLLSERFRSSDIVARYGGEEFCVLVPQLEVEHVFGMFNGFREVLAEQNIEIDGRALSVTVSIGVVHAIRNSLDELISEADALLYRAKQVGRNCVVMA